MKLSLDIDLSQTPELADRIMHEANRLGLSPQLIALWHLRVGLDIEQGNRAVILQGEDLTALEQRLGGGQIPTSADLVTRVERLARIEFGGHEIRLTPAELEELAWRARKNNKTVAQIVQQVWLSLNEQFFSYAQRS